MRGGRNYTCDGASRLLNNLALEAIRPPTHPVACRESLINTWPSDWPNVPEHFIELSRFAKKPVDGRDQYTTEVTVGEAAEHVALRTSTILFVVGMFFGGTVVWQGVPVARAYRFHRGLAET